MGEHDDVTKHEQQSKFEWRPEDITILNSGDEGYDDEEEPALAPPIEGGEPLTGERA